MEVDQCVVWTAACPSKELKVLVRVRDIYLGLRNSTDVFELRRRSNFSNKKANKKERQDCSDLCKPDSTAHKTFMQASHKSKGGTLIENIFPTMKLATTIIALLLSTWVVAAAAKQEKVSVGNLLDCYFLF
jgi:hypothetical protein